MTSFLKLSVAAALLIGTTNNNNSGVNAYSETAAKIAKLQRKLNPSPGDILDTLDQYDKFWIEVTPQHKNTSGKGGSCVWSECTLGYKNSGDDDEKGDGRDGDSQWYQYRTQSFCANAAYSLYGRKKYELNPLGWMGCSERHYINSFFTYGGADNLLRAIGKTPEIYYGENGEEYETTTTTSTAAAAVDYYYAYDDDDGADEEEAAYDDAVVEDEDEEETEAEEEEANEDANERRRRLEGSQDQEEDQDYDDDDPYVTWSEEYPTNSNCVCMEEDGYGGYSWIEEEQDEEDGRRRRLSGSQHSGSRDGQCDTDYTSTMGCDANGDYVMALFEGDSCDGNYFTQVIDTMSTYNKQHERIGCHALYKGESDSNSIKHTKVVELLKNSWTCDVTLYPNSCPDPYGVKRSYEYAMKQAQHGINPVFAMRLSEWRIPLRTASGIMFVITLWVAFVTYVVKNADRIKAQGGGWKVGLRCLCEDFKNLPKTIKTWRKSYMKALSERRAARQKARAAARQGTNKSGGRSWIKSIRLRSKSDRSKSSSSSKNADASEDKDDGQLHTSTVDTLDENVEIETGVIA